MKFSGRIWNTIGTIGAVMFIVIITGGKMLRAYPNVLNAIPPHILLNSTPIAFCAVLVSFIIFGVGQVVLAISNWVAREDLFKYDEDMPTKEHDAVAHKIIVIMSRVVQPAIAGLFLTAIGCYFAFELIKNWQEINTIFGLY